jgi:hypothetical protein
MACGLWSAALRRRFAVKPRAKNENERHKLKS